MRESRSYGSVRGVAGDRYPYRDPQNLFFARATGRAGQPGWDRRLSFRLDRSMGVEPAEGRGLIIKQIIRHLGVTEKGLLGFAAPGAPGERKSPLTPRTPGKPCSELNRGQTGGLEWFLLCAGSADGGGGKAVLGALRVPGCGIWWPRSGRDGGGRPRGGYGEGAGESAKHQPAAAGQTQSRPCR